MTSISRYLQGSELHLLVVYHVVVVDSNWSKLLYEWIRFGGKMQGNGGAWIGPFLLLPLCLRCKAEPGVLKNVYFYFFYPL